MFSNRHPTDQNLDQSALSFVGPIASSQEQASTSAQLKEVHKDLTGMDLRPCAFMHHDVKLHSGHVGEICSLELRDPSLYCAHGSRIAIHNALQLLLGLEYISRDQFQIAKEIANAKPLMFADQAAQAVYNREWLRSQSSHANNQQPSTSSPTQYSKNESEPPSASKTIAQNQLKAGTQVAQLRRLLLKALNGVLELEQETLDSHLVFKRIFSPGLKTLIESTPK